jgi:hypothetical protein
MGRFAIPMILFFGSLRPVDAGWVTIRNETDQPVVVQESCVVNNQVRRGKPVRLMPGEVLREYQSCPGTRAVQFLESGGANKKLFEGELKWDKDDNSFEFRCDGCKVNLSPAPRAAAVALLPKGR